MSPTVFYPTQEVVYAPAPFHLRMAAMISVLLTMDVALTQTNGLMGFAGQLAGILPGLGALACAYGYARWSGLPKFAEGSLMGIWAVLLSNLLSVLIQSAGRSSAPLMDGGLQAVDQYIGFSTASVVDWIGHFPALRLAFALAYASMPVLVLSALFLPVALGRTRDSQRFVMAVFAAALMTAALFAFVPAAGPWVSGAYAPSHRSGRGPVVPLATQDGQHASDQPGCGRRCLVPLVSSGAGDSSGLRFVVHTGCKMVCARAGLDDCRLHDHYGVALRN